MTDLERRYARLLRLCPGVPAGPGRRDAGRPDGLGAAGSAPAWSAMLGDWSMWRWTLIDMGILAILPLLDIAVGTTVAVRRARI